MAGAAEAEQFKPSHGSEADAAMEEADVNACKDAVGKSGIPPPPQPAPLETLWPTSPEMGDSSKELQHEVPGGDHRVHGEFPGGPQSGPSCQYMLLSLLPFCIVYTFQDQGEESFQSAMILATALSWFLLVLRMLAWGGHKLWVWPVIDAINCVMWPVLLGTSYRWFYIINKWMNLIAPGALGVGALLSIAARHPFTAAYGLYIPSDPSGKLLWANRPAWRTTCDITSSMWVISWIIMAALSLAPILTDNHEGTAVLNIIFNYIVPLVMTIMGIVMHQLLGWRYWVLIRLEGDNVHYSAETDVEIGHAVHGGVAVRAAEAAAEPAGPEAAGAAAEAGTSAAAAGKKEVPFTLGEAAIDVDLEQGAEQEKAL